MQYAGLIKNDVSAGSGVCVSFFVQGCPIHCPECHNPESWAFDGGTLLTEEAVKEALDAIKANGITRNFCIFGGEPLCKENLPLTHFLVKQVRQMYPEIKIYLWTGYPWKNIQVVKNTKIQEIMNLADYMITEPFKVEERDITLPMRGSRNQKVIDLKTRQEVECLNQVV